MTTGFAAWVERDVVRVAGPDAATFLQGQVSQDVEAMSVGTSKWSLVLAPTGRVDAWFRVTREGDDEFHLDVDRGLGEALIARLNRFKLRTKCDVDAVNGWRCLAIRGTTVEHPRARPIVWPGTVGVDLLGPGIEAPAGLAVDADISRLEVARIRAGVPAMGHELTEATIPAEAGQWLIDVSVSFTKGCFTGQELVARMDARGGSAPHPICGLRVSGPAEVGMLVVARGGRELGRITSAAADGGATIGLAPLPRATVVGEEVTVGGASAAVVELPMR
ncbi:MAG TPA: hypothetical protein VGZ52_00835 [Acidimicrobiales bacterium]|jgi:folate-binding protein YgfZ|nr:hypothetical protein [Acidimicrobiales bacterium]